MLSKVVCWSKLLQMVITGRITKFGHDVACLLNNKKHSIDLECMCGATFESSL